MTDEITDLEEHRLRKEGAPYETRTNQIYALSDRISDMLPREWGQHECAIMLAHAWLTAVGCPSGGKRVERVFRIITALESAAERAAPEEG
jgi:hypothetical protein